MAGCNIAFVVVSFDTSIICILKKILSKSSFCFRQILFNFSVNSLMYNTPGSVNSYTVFELYFIEMTLSANILT